MGKGYSQIDVRGIQKNLGQWARNSGEMGSMSKEYWKIF
jgi:hypothetical protein